MSVLKPSACVLLFASLLWTPVNNLQQLQCDKGHAEIKIKDTGKTLLRLNCGVKPMTVTTMEETLDGCYGTGNNKLTIISRSQWNASYEKIFLEPLQPTDCVLADGSSYTTNDKNYLAQIKIDEEFQINKYGSLFNNFHVADDGLVYETLGWDKSNPIRSAGLNCLRIAFHKSTTDVEPSEKAKKSFQKLIDAAICLGKLSPSYRLIPYYLTHDLNHLSPDSFERKGMTTWPNYVSDPELMEEEYDFSTFPIVFRGVWGGKEFLGTVYDRKDIIKYIMIGQYDVRCFTTENCLHVMKWNDGDFRKKKENFRSNYIIGDDGYAYEVFNWKETWNEYWTRKEAMLVEFYGRFQSYGPSKKAMIAFKRLLRLGVVWGYLAPDYKIVSYRQMDNDPEYIGDFLEAQMRKHPRFDPDF